MRFVLDNHIIIIASLLVMRGAFVLMKKYILTSKNTVDGEIILDAYLKHRHGKVD